MRIASCRCGQLTATCAGEPQRVSVCHCLACQRRTGSAFSAQARWPAAQVTLAGEWTEWAQRADSGNRTTFRFCSTCGSTVTWSGEGMPGLTYVPIGAFADPGFPAPTASVYEERRHAWVEIGGEGVERMF